jgi:hypothetical protein
MLVNYSFKEKENLQECRITTFTSEAPQVQRRWIKGVDEQLNTLK